MIKVIIFDFDGVIADSNNVKTEAFVKIFEGYPQHIKESIKKFHLQNGGMSRFDKFRYIYANFLKEPLPEEKFNELCSNFNRLVFDGVMNAPMVEGVESFLKRDKGRYDMYIVSGTPEHEIKEIVKLRKLNEYFSGIYGSPKTKKELIEYIVKKNNYKSEEVVFLGDSINDYEGAKGSGVKFVAKICDNLEFDPFPNIALEVKIKTMEEFKNYLDKKMGNRHKLDILRKE